MAPAFVTNLRDVAAKLQNLSEIDAAAPMKEYGHRERHGHGCGREDRMHAPPLTSAVPLRFREMGRAHPAARCAPWPTRCSSPWR